MLLLNSIYSNNFQILLLQKDYLGMVPVFPAMAISVAFGQFPRKHLLAGSAYSDCSEDSC